MLEARKPPPDTVRNYILIRETLDWESASYADLRDDPIRMMARAWDSTFAISYFECRARIKALAQSFLRAIPDATVVFPGDVADIDVASQDLLLIGDDDDWYSPRIFDELRGSVDFDRHEALVWPDAVAGFHVRWQPGEGEARIEDHLQAAKLRPLVDVSAYSAIKTNNYALTRLALGNLLAESLKRYIGHTVAAESLAARLHAGDAAVAVLDRYLSVANRHPCSYLVLVQGVGTADSAQLANLVRHYVRGLESLRLQNEVAWAIPHLSAMRHIFLQVADSLRLP
jgi:hypothetical protein